MHCRDDDGDREAHANGHVNVNANAFPSEPAYPPSFRPILSVGVSQP